MRRPGRDREDGEMIHDAQVNLAGYVATEPKFRKVAGDTSSAKLRVAYTARRRDKETGEWGDGPTSFVNVQCWRTLADNVAMSVHKGEPVLVVGRLQIRRYEDPEGSPRTAAEIEATSVGHDLARGVAKFSRTRWPSAASADETEAPAGAPGPGNGAESAGGLAAGAQPATGGRAADANAADGNGVIDERAVAEFARELSESLGASATADPGTDAGGDAGEDAEADAEVGEPA
jgi:single-strand DNA-binding protein